MIFTSYFANWRKFPSDYKQISIARYSPKGFNGSFYSSLAPEVELLGNIKGGKIDEAEYSRLFNLQLEKLNPKEVYDLLNGSILLCYEKKGDFCHRHLVSKWLQNNGYNVEEL